MRGEGELGGWLERGGGRRRVLRRGVSGDLKNAGVRGN